MVRTERCVSPMPARCLPALLAAAALAVGAGCGGGGDEGAGEAPEPAAKPAAEKPAAQPAAGGGESAAARADEIFATRCATCHGPKGAGDGPGSKGLTPQPRNFQDPEWQAEVSDEHIRKIIQYGGAAVGRSPVMPGNPDLISKPEVLDALVAHIRELGGS